MSRSGPRILAIVLLCTMSAIGCGGERSGTPPTVDIMAEEYEFTVPDSVPAGWINFRLHNQGSEHHLFYLGRLPETVTFADFRSEVIAPYDSVWSLVVDGAIDPPDAYKRLGSALPNWYPYVQFGGVSLTAPGRTAETTVRLEPGTYTLVCYALTSDGQFHALEGMVAPLTVYPSATDGAPPEADYQLTISNLQLSGAGPASAGERTFAVRFERDPEGAGGGEGHQHLHLARLEEETSVDELTEWITDWIGENPATPPPVEFVGGPQHRPEGSTVYTTVDLKPGRYAWLLGVPPEHGEIETFTVE